MFINQVNPHPLIGIPAWSDESLFYSGVSTYGMNQSYISTLQDAGAIPILIPLHLNDTSLRGIFERLDGLFLAGGGDIAPRLYNRRSRELLDSTDFERDLTELILTNWALEANMPILGVCRGMQLINVACGGTLYRDLREQHSQKVRHDYIGPMYKRDKISHDVEIKGGSYLSNIFGSRIGVNSMHNQGIHDLGSDLQVSAHSADGLAEAVESTSNSFVLGTQWHPEDLFKSDSRNATIYHDFLQAAGDSWRYN